MTLLQVRGEKTVLRLCCRAFKEGVDQRTQKLTWRWSSLFKPKAQPAELPTSRSSAQHSTQQAAVAAAAAAHSTSVQPYSPPPPPTPATLPSSLLESRPRLTHVSFSHLTTLTCLPRLAGPVLVTLLVLDCSHTQVVDLSPLHACRALQSLTCSNTAVYDLAPVSPCTQLHILNCSHTGVSSLAPLVACKGLHTVRVSHTPVTDVGPLLSCPQLSTLYRSESGISYEAATNLLISLAARRGNDADFVLL